MGIFTKEDKANIAFMGIDAGLKLFDDYRESSKKQREKDLEDGKIDKDEYNRVCNELDEYQDMIYNLISDTELSSKFRKTEEYFVSIIKVIMLDLEFDYKEVFENLCNFIDNEDFISGHENAIKKREERLDKEYEEALNKYDLELKEYEIQLKAHNSKGFFKKLVSSNTAIQPPKRPVRRE